MKSDRVLGIFDDYASFTETIRRVREAGLKPVAAYTPVPCHEVDRLLGRGESHIGRMTLLGGLLGFGLGAALTVYCSKAYSMIVGGKPIISVPPYLIIAFELTILFGTILTALGYFVLSPILRKGVRRSYDPSFTQDRFGLLVEGEREELKRMMEDAGAVETRLA